LVAAVPSGPNWTPPPTIPIKKNGSSIGRVGGGGGGGGCSSSSSSSSSSMILLLKGNISTAGVLWLLKRPENDCEERKKASFKILPCLPQ
jgi:hypothetical protein